MSASRNWFSVLASGASRAAGRAPVFALAVSVVVVWGLSGPLFDFSDTWQLVINTGTTIVTFLMVFLIQNSQNRDSAAIQVKLDELIRTGHVRNAFIGIEHLNDDELDELKRKIEARAARHGHSDQHGHRETGATGGSVAQTSAPVAEKATR
ncbi:membrane protein [Afipia sp. P52-10]|uniref:low affinity iron permease family protein n=1 Tax=Afipia sp. P52-10 TaxID=1429916 RepID=UPI0003DEFE30|nr:low affinity iron permease family protein [Afipia sp. P52-10]ETR76584.1 membrane protein [Afipia sp. P52-10]